VPRKPLIHLEHWSIDHHTIFGGTSMNHVVTAPSWLPEWLVRRRAHALAARAMTCPMPDLPLDTITKTRRDRVTRWRFTYRTETSAGVLL